MANNSIPKTSGIYKITCTVNGKIYIGSAVNLNRRWYEHQLYLQKHKHHNQHLQRAWDAYGQDAFTFEIMELVMPFVLFDRENYWLKTLKPYNHKIGFNIGHKAESGMAGREHSVETRAKISAANKGKIVPKEQAIKAALAHTGLKRSPETKEKMRLAAIERNKSPEYIAKIVAANTGKKRSPETCANIGNGKRGKKFSPEARARMSEARKGNKNALGTKQSLETIAKKNATRKRNQEKHLLEIETNQEI